MHRVRRFILLRLPRHRVVPELRRRGHGRADYVGCLGLPRDIPINVPIITPANPPVAAPTRHARCSSALFIADILSNAIMATRSRAAADHDRAGRGRRGADRVGADRVSAKDCAACCAVYYGPGAACPDCLAHMPHCLRCGEHGARICWVNPWTGGLCHACTKAVVDMGCVFGPFTPHCECAP